MWWVPALRDLGLARREDPRLREDDPTSSGFALALPRLRGAGTREAAEGLPYGDVTRRLLRFARKDSVTRQAGGLMTESSRIRSTRKTRVSLREKQ